MQAENELMMVGLRGLLRGRHWRDWTQAGGRRNGYTFKIPRDEAEFKQAARIIHNLDVNASPSWDELMDIIVGS